MAWSYDAIADVYATDMGASMPFDDIGWYAALCEEGVGAALELGCGSGRILIELLARGIDVTGVDRSLPMLKRLRTDAEQRGLRPCVAQMDLRALALKARFATILAPYSLITYLTNTVQARGVMATLRALLADGGTLVLDAFVPQPIAASAQFRLDYIRPHAGGTLERCKRITALADGCNRIERHYRILDADGSVVDQFDTDETIRPYTESDLLALGEAAGLSHVRTSHDYSTTVGHAEARFASVVLRAP